MSIVDMISICRLGGFVGSNPEILGTFPVNEKPQSDVDIKDYLNKSIPFGVAPGSFTIEKFKDKLAVSYLFTLKSQDAGVRDDLTSITVVISDKKVNVDDFKKLFVQIIESFKDEMEKLTPTLLVNTIERIYNGMNKNEKIKLDKAIIDVPQIIKKAKLTLMKVDLDRLKGGFF
jgi:hypothetical protein